MLPARHQPLLRTALLAALALCAAPPGIRAEPLVWVESDWSGGHYRQIQDLDAEVAPGLVVLENLPAEMRFLAEPTSYRGIYAMTTYHDSLFMGAGPYPLTADGADVLTYDPRTGEVALNHQLEQQGIIVMKVFGDTLFIPGPDGLDPWTANGIVYLYNGHEWIEHQGIPYGIHLFDLEVVDGRLYVSDGNPYGIGNVWASSDWGQTVTNILAIQPTPENPVRRVYGVGGHAGKLYVQHDGLPPETDQIYRYDGVSWDTLTTPNLPHEKQGLFTAWGDSLLLTIANRMYVIHGDEVHGSWMPFSGDRWCRSVHVYKDSLYGGALDGVLYRWTPASGWDSIGVMCLDPETEEIEQFSTLHGRLYAVTSRFPEGVTGGRLYVSAARPHGELISVSHDFHGAALAGTLSWSGHAPDTLSSLRFQLRSANDVEQLQGAPFVGPDGTPRSYYTRPGTPLAAVHRGHRLFQYRAELNCPDGIDMPFLEELRLAVDTLDFAGVPEDAPAPVRIACGPPQPNPARTVAVVPVRVAGARCDEIVMQVLDVQGRRVRTARVPLDASGSAAWQWDLHDQAGRPVPSGIYRIAARERGAGAHLSPARSLLVLP